MIKEDTALGEHDLLDHPSEGDVGERVSAAIFDYSTFKMVRMRGHSSGRTRGTNRLHLSDTPRTKLLPRSVGVLPQFFAERRVPIRQPWICWKRHPSFPTPCSVPSQTAFGRSSSTLSTLAAIVGYQRPLGMAVNSMRLDNQGLPDPSRQTLHRDFHDGTYWVGI